MSQPEPFEMLVLGSGEGGKFLAWHLAKSGQNQFRPRWVRNPGVNVSVVGVEPHLSQRTARSPVPKNS